MKNQTQIIFPSQFGSFYDDSQKDFSQNEREEVKKYAHRGARTPDH